MNTRESRYPSDLSDKEWAILEPLMPETSWFTHRPREHSYNASSELANKLKRLFPT